MFDQKRKELIKKPVVQVQSSDKKSAKKGNAFTSASRRASVTTTSGNGSIKVTTTNNDFVDQFAKASTYRQPRSYADIAKDMELLWSQDPTKTLKLSLYLRLVTRVINVSEGVSTEETQRGQGLKHEGIMRMLWVAVNHRKTFHKNLPLLVACGGWKDIFQLLSIDIQYNEWQHKKLDWYEIGQFILAGLQDPSQSELIKKYLPKIKSSSECNTIESQAKVIVGKYLCSLLFGNKADFDPSKEDTNSGATYKKYRLLKSTGTAHEWQQIISQKRMKDLNFDKVHGRALTLLVKSKFLKNQNLSEAYSKWIAAKPVAKYTGFAYELFTPLGQGSNMTKGKLEPYLIDTMNKQFLGLIETAKNGMKSGDSKLMPVIDTSGSMSSICTGTKVSSHTVAKVFALYFSYLLDGVFANHYLEFSNDTIMKEWKGSTPVDKLVNDNSSITAGTNFLSVADHFVKILKQGIPLGDFPTGIICISDGEFNRGSSNQSSFKELLNRLRRGGFPQPYVDNFKVILWDTPNSYYGKTKGAAFEEFADCPNLFHVGGLDGAAIAFITGTNHQTSPVRTSEELFEAAITQEVFSYVEL